MSEPLRVPLSPFQLARFAAFRTEQEAATQAIQVRVNDSLTAILAGVVDTTTLQGWDIRIADGAIVCTPPVVEGG